MMKVPASMETDVLGFFFFAGMKANGRANTRFVVLFLLCVFFFCISPLLCVIPVLSPPPYRHLSCSLSSPDKDEVFGSLCYEQMGTPTVLP
jgi:hypothetical protein